ncbi:Uncharacterized protein APZ42_032213 [Daphnia magna]|uniref:Integrase core domain-containing protein n=1 Tax=Daphnia magna TaxID=35525 RepID=A0A164M6A6_9CRUS|nr:Uncharacterized protein APZ42_032213 [Daphnia magna]
MLRSNPKFGLQMFKGCTISKNIVLKQKQLGESCRRVRQKENAPMIQRIKRRECKVRAPLSLWHIDGHHKMDRSDEGRENVLVADFMINARVVKRKSFRTGFSVHNQRVERLWRDTIERCTSTFMEMFKQMERDDILDVGSDVDFFCLHVVG